MAASSDVKMSDNVNYTDLAPVEQALGEVFADTVNEGLSLVQMVQEWSTAEQHFRNIGALIADARPEHVASSSLDLGLDHNTTSKPSIFPILSLPPELQLSIFSLLTTSLTRIRLKVYHHTKLKTRRLVQSTFKPPPRKRSLSRNWNHTTRKSLTAHSNALSLLLVNKYFHATVKPLVYSHNTFIFHSCDSIAKFCSLSAAAGSGFGRPGVSLLKNVQVTLHDRTAMKKVALALQTARQLETLTLLHQRANHRSTKCLFSGRPYDAALLAEDVLPLVRELRKNGTGNGRECVVKLKECKCGNCLRTRSGRRWFPRRPEYCCGFAACADAHEEFEEVLRERLVAE